MREEICQLVLCHTNLVVPWTHQSNCTNTSWMRKKCLFEITHYRKISCPRRSTTCIHTYGAWSSLPQKSRKCFLVQPGVIRFSNSSICSWTGRVHEVKREAKHATKINSNTSEKDSAHLKLLLLNKPMSCTRNHMLDIQQTAKNHEKDLRTTATAFAPTDSQSSQSYHS